MFKSSQSLSLTLLVLLALPISAHAKPEKLLTTGSSTMAPLVAELAKEYEKKLPELRIDVQTGGSSKGISDCRDKLSDFGMVSRSLTAEEKDLGAVKIAQDGIAFIANQSVKIRELTSAQIVKIYKGEVSNWKELGGDDQKIVVMNKAEGRAALDVFLHHFKLKSSEIKASFVIGDEEQGLKTISSSPGSIGYISISAAEQALEQKAPIHTLRLDGQAPEVKAVLSGQYPLVRPLNLVSCGKSPDAVALFSRFATSEEGQTVVRRLGYIALK